MDPGCFLLYEAVKELGSRDRARWSATHVLHIRHPAFQLPCVTHAKRHTPRALALGSSRVEEGLREGVVVGKDACVLVPECHHHRAGQSSEVDHRGGFEALLRVPHDVAEDETPFGIGVDDLDGITFHRANHIAGALRATIRHVFDQADQPDHVGSGVAKREGAHHARNGTRAAHVHCHVFHAGGRLHRNAAGVKGDALADQGQRRFLAAAIPLHHHDLRGAFAALAHRQKSPHPECLQLGLVQNLNL